MEDIFFCVQSESATSFTTLFSTTPWQTITSQWLGFQTIWATKRSFIEFHRAATFSTRYRFIFIRYAVRGEAPTFHQIQSCHNSRSSFLFHHPLNPPPIPFPLAHSIIEIINYQCRAGFIVDLFRERSIRPYDFDSPAQMKTTDGNNSIFDRGRL